MIPLCRLIWRKKTPICKNRTTIFWVLSSIVILSPACLQLTKSTLMTNCLTGLTASPGLPRTGDHFLRLVCSRVWTRWMDVALFAKQWELAVRSFFAGGSSQACTQATDNNYLIFAHLWLLHHYRTTMGLYFANFAGYSKVSGQGHICFWLHIKSDDKFLMCLLHATKWLNGNFTL